MMRTRFVLFVLLCFSVQLSYGQLEAANWYFGFNAGIRFDPDTGSVTALTDGSLATEEGCSTISNVNGDLLFYTDGITVYDRTHAVMQNGNGLKGNPSSTQSGIIIPKPGNTDVYYIFTVDTGANGGQDTGLHYYEVDVSLNGGLGAVITDIANPPNLLSGCSEKIAAIGVNNSEDIFVSVLASLSGIEKSQFDTIHTFRVGASGVGETPVKSSVSTIEFDRRGYLKFSADGKNLVSANMREGTYLYDFDATTGIVSNERNLNLPSPNSFGYGVEFSPNNQFLYVSASNDANISAPASSHRSSIYQFEIDKPTIGEINGSRLEVYSGLGYRGALQLGINGKIYRALSDNYDIGKPFLGVINNPDIKGAGSNYQNDAIPLNGPVSRQGLPPFIQSFFAIINVENVCSGETTLLSFESDTAPDSVLWEFGDGFTSMQFDATHQYSSSGIYDIVLTLDFSGTTKKFFKEVEIFISPMANIATNINACDINLDGMEMFNLIDTNLEILGTQDPSIFKVTYYTSHSDADLAENSVGVPLTVSVSQLELFARVENTFNSECYDTTSFLIQIYDQPNAYPLEELEQCDDNFDGISTFLLTDQNAVILRSQDPASFSVSYHLNSIDATNGMNPLPDSYRNKTAFRQTIYARIANKAENSCKDVSSFDIVVLDRPQAANFSAFQCDEDGIPDRITNFNLSSFDASIAMNGRNVEVTYYLNQIDANADSNRIDNRDYRNLSPIQDIIARVTDSTTGCFNTATVTLSVSASDAQDTSLELCDDDGIQDGFQIFTLSDANAAVLANAPNNLTVNYYASTIDALAERNTLPTQYTNTTTYNQIIYARAESPDGNCYGISEVRLIVNELPQVEPTAYFEYCGNDPQALSIDAGPLPGSINDYTYQWNTGETTYAIDVRNGGIYNVIATNASSCTSSREITVVISEPATINSIDVINANGERFGSATAIVSGLGDYEFRIDPNAGFQTTPVFDKLPPGFYILEVNDRNGCGTVFQKFSVVGYPRFFTPNGDGFNDFWQLDGVNSIFEPDATIFIFDRYGKLLKQLSPSSNGWDGTFSGEPLPSNDYWFKATLTDGTEFSSHFTLKR
jgi:gliding motility-associated-like protein